MQLPLHKRRARHQETKMHYTPIATRLLRAGQTLAVAFALTFALVAPTWASVTSEQQAGAQVQSAVREGRLKTSTLSSSQYESVGEYLMGQALGSTASHERMNSLMAQMTGSGAVDQMHIYLGERYFGKSAQIPRRYAPMYGLAGMMAGSGGSSIAGMMRGYLGGQSRSSSPSTNTSGMMGSGTQGQEGSAGGWSTGAIVATTALSMLLLGGGLAFAGRIRRRRRGGLPGLPADSPIR